MKTDQLSAPIKINFVSDIFLDGSQNRLKGVFEKSTRGRISTRVPLDNPVSNIFSAIMKSPLEQIFMLIWNGIINWTITINKLT